MNYEWFFYVMERSVSHTARLASRHADHGRSVVWDQLSMNGMFWMWETTKVHIANNN